MTARAYGVLANYYDALMAHVDYEAWATYALKRLSLPPEAPEKGVTIVDLGCGTGNVALALAARGYDVIGIDGSEHMLAVAHQKAEEEGLSITFVQRDLTDFEVGYPVDGVVCLCDTLNYLTRDGDLDRAFTCIARALKPDGGLVFDVHTPKRMEEMAASVYADELDDVAYIWHSEYDSKTRLCTMYVTLFVEGRNGLYKRFEEVHVERAYEAEEIAKALKGANFTLTGTYGPWVDQAPADDASRIFYHAKRSCS